MSKEKYKQIGRKLAIKAIREKIRDFIVKVDILNGEEKRLVIEGMEKAISELKDDISKEEER